MTQSEAGRLGGIACSIRKNKKNQEKYRKKPVRCKSCNKVIEFMGTNFSAYKKRKFCNHSCAAKFNRNRIGIYKEGGSICSNCGHILPYNRKYCNSKCQQEHHWKQTASKIKSGKKLSSYIMKRHLIYIYGEKCLNPECGWDWNKKCVIELEHIDGDSLNNDISNLTLLCPNCHSNTPTYKAKNTGNGRYKRKQRYREGKSY